MSECVICRAEDVVPTTILEPCGHKAVCDVCLKTLLELVDFIVKTGHRDYYIIITLIRLLQKGQ